MENVDQKQPSNAPSRFTAPDWIILFGSVIFVSAAFVSILVEIFVLLKGGKVESAGQSIGQLIWLVVFAWILKNKLKILKQVKTPKVYRIVVAVCATFVALIIIPAFFSALNAYNRVKNVSSLSAEQQEAIGKFFEKVSTLQSSNQKIKIATAALMAAEGNEEYNEKSAILLKDAQDFQIIVDKFLGSLGQYSNTFNDTTTTAAVNMVREVFEFRSEYNKRLIEFTKLGASIDFENRVQAAKLLALGNELSAMEKRLPELTTKYIDAMGSLDPKIKEQLTQQKEKIK